MWTFTCGMAITENNVDNFLEVKHRVTVGHSNFILAYESRRNKDIYTKMYTEFLVILLE